MYVYIYTYVYEYEYYYVLCIYMYIYVHIYIYVHMIYRMTYKFHLNIDVYHSEVGEAEAEEVAVVETDELEELLADARRWVDIHCLGDLMLGRHGILYVYIYIYIMNLLWYIFCIWYSFCYFSEILDLIVL